MNKEPGAPTARRSTLLILTFCLCILGILALIGWLAVQNPKPATVIYNSLTGHFSEERPPWWFQRIQQRREVRARIQSAGGWDALRSDCVRWLRENQNTNLIIWYKGQTNGPALPPTMAALQPMFINAFPPDVIEIHLYGRGEGPGHRGIARYGLEVDLAPKDPNEPNTYPTATYHKMATDIYEWY